MTKYKFCYIFLALALLTFSFTPQEDGTIVISHANVIPMNKEQVLNDHTVIIKDGLIVSISPSSKTKIPAGAREINAGGKYLIPGLMDMHAHFFYEQGENINTCEQELKVMLANGLTTARILCGDPVYLDARKNVSNRQWTGPDLFVASPQFVGKYPWPGKVFAAICTTPAEAEQAVKKFRREGYDEIKITFLVKADVYDAIIRTAKEEKIKVCGHVGPLVKLPRALAARQQIEHMDEFIEMLLPDTSFNHGMSVSDMGVWKKAHWETVDHLDEKRIPALVKQVKNAGIYVTPTNYFFVSCFGTGQDEGEIRNKPDFGFIPGKIKDERWEVREHYRKNIPSAERRAKYVDLRLKMTYALWKGGVKLMSGSDSPEWFLVQGFSIHDELEMMTKAGLTPFAALETSTKNPAGYLGIIDHSGTIENGKKADLVLLDANPLDNIRNTRSINTVIKGGRIYTTQDLKTMLEEAKTILNK